MLNIILLNARTRLRALTASAKTEAFSRIAAETGLTVSWLQKFADGRISNPTVTSLDTLIAYLDKSGATGPAPCKPARPAPPPAREAAA